MNKIKLYKRYCIGCGICKSVKGIEFDVSSKGYLVPKVKEKNKDYIEFCNKVCPIGKESFSKLKSGSIWGGTQDIFVSHSNDDDIRYRASSGGVLSTIAIYLLDTKKVDYIIQTVASKSNPIKNETYISSNKEDILLCLGSRYGISSPLMNLLDNIDADKKYAFIGKPCDVTALQNYMEINTNLRKNIIYTLSFLCAGMPSNAANENLLKKLNSSTDDCISLRYRGNGWPGTVESISKKGSINKMEYEYAWGQILGRDIHPFCRFCMDGIGERADISCGDAWNLTDRSMPDFNESKGENVVFARTVAGLKLLDDMKKSEYLTITHFGDISKLYSMQKYQVDRKTTMIAKILACKLLFRIHPPYKLRKLKSYSGNTTVKRYSKVFIGSIKRIILNKM